MKMLRRLLLLLNEFICMFLCDEIYQPVTEEVFQVTKSPECGHVFTNQTFGIITSPFYPFGYPDGIVCKWQIILEGSRIALSLKTFVLGPGDRLVITDSTETRRYTFAYPPDDVIFSNGNELNVELRSDDGKALESNQAFVDLKRNRTFYAIFEKEGCGGLLTQPSGYIAVPSYIHFSKQSHECAWIILGGLNQIIVLQFLQFDLPPGSCLYDTVYIREGDRLAGYLLGEFCEENPPYSELRSSNNVIYIAYRSRPNMLASHFEMIPRVKMFYKTSSTCGGALTSFTGSISIPNRWLDGVFSCNWSIEVPLEKYISITFQDWIFQNNTEKEHDELGVTMPTQNVTLWNSKMNIAPPRYMIVPSNKVFISLRSYRQKTSSTKIRFHAVYQAMNSNFKQCIDVGYRQLFMCDDWKYVDCSMKCDGVRDCENGQDESSCPITILDKSVAVFDHRSKHHQRALSLSLLLFAVFGILTTVVMVVITVERLCHHRRSSERCKRRHSQQNFPDLQPPPYSEIQDMHPHSLFPPPPPYRPNVNLLSANEANIESERHGSLEAESVDFMNDNKETCYLEEYSEDVDGIIEPVWISEFQVNDDTSEENDFNNDVIEGQPEHCANEAVVDDDEDEDSDDADSISFIGKLNIFTELDEVTEERIPEDVNVDSFNNEMTNFFFIEETSNEMIKTAVIYNQSIDADIPNEFKELFHNTDVLESSSEISTTSASSYDVNTRSTSSLILDDISDEAIDISQ